MPDLALREKESDNRYARERKKSLPVDLEIRSLSACFCLESNRFFNDFLFKIKEKRKHSLLNLKPLCTFLSNN